MTVITNNRGRALLAGIGAGLVALGAIAAVYAGQGMQNRALTAAHQLPKATTPTVTKYLPGATTTITPKPLPRATITKQLPQATKTIIKKVPQATITCGHAEDDCYPDYIGKGRWVIRHGERSLPKATKKVPPATTALVCRSPRITGAMVADCNELAKLPKKVDAQGNERPAGKVLVRECLESYTNSTELGWCLQQR
jgi:hypothetical protein